MGPLFRCEGCGQAVADKVAAFAAAVKAGQYDAQGYTVHERRLVVRGRGMGQPGAVPICPTCRGARPCGCDGGGR